MIVRRAVRVFLFLVSTFAVVAFLIIGVRLVTRPDAVDPTEVAVLEQAGHIANSETIYPEPHDVHDRASMPGFPFAVSLMVRMFGVGLWEPRFLALLAMLLLTGLVMVIVHLETSDWTLTVTSAGSVLMGYGLLAEPPGMARPETLMLLLALLGFFALRITNGIWGALLAALLFAAAFYTGVQAAWWIAAALFALAFDERRRLVAFTLMIAVTFGGGYVALSHLLGPWFNFSAWDGPIQSMHFRPAGPLHYIGDHLLGKLGVPTLAAVLSFALPTPPWRGKGGLWMCMGIATLGAGLMSTQMEAFGHQSLLPSVVALGMLGAISMQRVTRHLSAYPGSTRIGGQSVVLAALALQFVVFLSCLSASRWLSDALSVRPTSPRPAATATAPAQLAARRNASATPSAVAGRMPTSVMRPVISSCAVMSNPGLRAAVPTGATRTRWTAPASSRPSTVRTSSADRSSIGILVPVAVPRSIVVSGAAT